MARVELLSTVDKLISDADLLSPYLSPVVGASVLVKTRATGTPVTVYAAETGGTTVANPLVTDANGRINGWVDEGSLVLTISGAGITTYNQPYEAVRGDGVSNIADGVITSAKFAAGVSQGLFDTGDLKLSARSAAPTGWLVCNGAAVSRTGTTAALFSAIGTTYGAGDGSTTFNLPDFRGRVPVGVDSAGVRLTSLNTLGNAAGAESHTLALTEIPSHTHTDNIAYASGGSHTHSDTFAVANGNIGQATGWNLPIADTAWLSAFFVVYASDGQPIPHANGATASISWTSGVHSHTLTGAVSTAAAHSHTKSGGVLAAGGGLSHNNMPPYQVVNVFIKT